MCLVGLALAQFPDVNFERSRTCCCLLLGIPPTVSPYLHVNNGAAPSGISSRTVDAWLCNRFAVRAFPLLPVTLSTMEMSAILSLLCFPKGKVLELGFKMRVVWSERGSGLGTGMGVTMGQHGGCCLEGREVIQVMGSLLQHPQKAGCSQGAQQSCTGLVKLCGKPPVRRFSGLKPQTRCDQLHLLLTL